MIINLSPKAMFQVRGAANSESKNVQQFTELLLERLFSNESCYVVIQPIPPPDKLNAINSMMNLIIDSPEFFGFKLISKEEAIAAAREHFKMGAADESIDTANKVEGQETGYKVDQAEETTGTYAECHVADFFTIAGVGPKDDRFPPIAEDVIKFYDRHSAETMLKVFKRDYALSDDCHVAEHIKLRNSHGPNKIHVLPSAADLDAHHEEERIKEATSGNQE